MHSRIIQIDCWPLPKEDWYISPLHETDHWFNHEIADYVDEDDDRNMTIGILREIFESMGDTVKFCKDSEGDGECFIFSDGFQEAYFADRFRRYNEVLNTLSNESTLQAFCGYDIVWKVFELLHNIVDKDRSFYIESESNIVTLDNFIRDAKTETPYYICATADYHW